MNHFMLPAPASPDGGEWGSVASRATRYGSAAMEQLINEILKAGGRRNDLEIKVFGGGRVLTKMTDIGRRNIEFAETFLATEGLKILARDVGETCAREVHYFPATGLARVRHLKPTNQELVVARERAYKKRLATKPVTGEVEFF
jgi:chemotaxis protein CheD